MIQLLLDLLEAPDPCTLETFLGRVHMVFNVVILSPHCYFAQDNVLGYPDTGGQVVYILDQVRVSENEMLNRIKKHGLDITLRILIDVALELAKELQANPDLKTDHNKPIIFTMARLDRVKNITGLVMWYGKNARLCELVNLVVVVGDKRKESKDLEEKAEMNNMYGLIETYKLKDQFRWISSQMYARNNYGFNTISWI
ncbi:hypothetical protein JHK82_039472 [Glycine max]|nr:hypothetical protein JHK82_039472 [Glycine max]KAG5121537.1 hypothetical protein JHK84_039877 [Glycine max]